MPDPGWYDDPQDDTQVRWWDGARWSEQRQPRAAAEPPPPPAPDSPAPDSPAPPDASGSYGIPLSEPADPWGSGSTGRSGRSGGAGGSAGARGASSGTPGGGWGAAGAGSGAVIAGAAPPRSFIDAVKVCLTKYVDGKGRASRSEYWYFALFTLVVDIVTGGIALILFVLPTITVTVRRLHDIGKSGWALLWALVPVVGLIVLIVYAVRPGEPGANAYG